MSNLTPDERRDLLRLARAALEAAVREQPPPAVDAAELPAALLEHGASFITLTHHDELRGCIGGLEPRWPLWQDVCEHTAQAALKDYRFPPVTPDEAPQIKIEVSVLTPPQPLTYASPDDLLLKLRPQVDGVTLSDGRRRATFLPQVWERIAQPEQFLSMLCEKMGLPPDTWRRAQMGVETYQVEKFTEDGA